MSTMKIFGKERKINNIYDALFCGDLETVKRFSAGVNYNYIPNAMEICARNGRLDVFKYLASCRADIHERSETPLFTACLEGHFDIVEFIISQGVDLQFNHTLEKLFFIACRKGHMKIIKYLVSLGADVCAMANTAIYMASSVGHYNVVKYLVSRGAEVRDDLIVQAAKNGHFEVVKYLHTFGPCQDAISQAMKEACVNDHFEVVKFLVSKGVQPLETISEKCKAYLSFCEKMKKKIRHRAAKKIYYWIIPILYKPGSLSAYNLGIKGYMDCFG